jgi:hypothetical protein
MLRYRSAACPYCGESQKIEIDLSEGLPQEFTWDCSVCCRPMEVRIAADARGEPVLRLLGEDEAGL